MKLIRAFSLLSYYSASLVKVIYAWDLHCVFSIFFLNFEITVEHGLKVFELWLKIFPIHFEKKTSLLVDLQMI